MHKTTSFLSQKHDINNKL